LAVRRLRRHGRPAEHAADVRQAAHAADGPGQRATVDGRHPADADGRRPARRRRLRHPPCPAHRRAAGLRDLPEEGGRRVQGGLPPMKLGYFLSCEEFGPGDLIAQARRAEAAGFHALWISDHYHPWNDAQGHSPFVWSVIGALSAATSLPVTTAVTCPTTRIHPAIIAQAAATSAVLLDGRFHLGVGTGEALNEHVTGARWPEIDVLVEMLEEAVEVTRSLWRGGQRTPHGRHYTVENARV